MTEVQTYLIKGTNFEISKQSTESPTRFVRIGDKVRIMIKDYQTWKTFTGIVASFDNFNDLPTFNIVYVDTSYSTAQLKTTSYNEESKDVKIAFCNPNSKDLTIDKTSILAKLDANIENKQRELSDALYMRNYFDKNFHQFFGGV